MARFVSLSRGRMEAMMISAENRHKAELGEFPVRNKLPGARGFAMLRGRASLRGESPETTGKCETDLGKGY